MVRSERDSLFYSYPYSQQCICCVVSKFTLLLVLLPQRRLTAGLGSADLRFWLALAATTMHTDVCDRSGTSAAVSEGYRHASRGCTASISAHGEITCFQRPCSAVPLCQHDCAAEAVDVKWTLAALQAYPGCEQALWMIGARARQGRRLKTTHAGCHSRPPHRRRAWHRLPASSTSPLASR